MCGMDGQSIAARGGQAQALKGDGREIRDTVSQQIWPNSRHTQKVS